MWLMAVARIGFYICSHHFMYYFSRHSVFINKLFSFFRTHRQACVIFMSMKTVGGEHDIKYTFSRFFNNDSLKKPPYMRERHILCTPIYDRYNKLVIGNAPSPIKLETKEVVHNFQNLQRKKLVTFYIGPLLNI